MKEEPDASDFPLKECDPESWRRSTRSFACRRRWHRAERLQKG